MIGRAIVSALVAVLTTTAGLAFWGAAPARVAQGQHEILMAATTSTSEADLATTMTGPFSATVTNNGPDSAVNVVVTDSLFNAAFTGVTASAPSGASCSTQPPAVCTTGSLAPGAVMTMTVFVVRECRFGVSQAIGSTATATSSTPDPNPSNNTAEKAERCSSAPE